MKNFILTSKMIMLIGSTKSTFIIHITHLIPSYRIGLFSLLNIYGRIIILDQLITGQKEI